MNWLEEAGVFLKRKQERSRVWGFAFWISTFLNPCLLLLVLVTALRALGDHLFRCRCASIWYHRHYTSSLRAGELNHMTKIQSTVTQPDFINRQTVLQWSPPPFWKLCFLVFFFFLLLLVFPSYLTYPIPSASFIILLKLSKTFAPLNSLNSGAFNGS